MQIELGVIFFQGVPSSALREICLLKELKHKNIVRSVCCPNWLYLVVWEITGHVIWVDIPSSFHLNLMSTSINLKLFCLLQTTWRFAQWQEVNLGFWILWPGEIVIPNLRYVLCVLFKANVCLLSTAGFEEVFWQLQWGSRSWNCEGKR